MKLNFTSLVYLYGGNLNTEQVGGDETRLGYVRYVQGNLMYLHILRSYIFGMAKKVQMQRGPIFECHLNMEEEPN